ncbi:MAG TPA: hypothetical protein IGS53_03950 [Leptolyngbyaceae cyanobacterium M33_DOE_097]|uniref:Uncharacterized protein n=1 Tax=Oscillatoriales cyanobacterium SpSt-418 TaxID=2282169 RepID=A0A7C3PIX7_9CYAN|nr:hypothetical protein [Leptolyngbyaceae cyanobacterium M33_DOE_097]
MKIGTGRPIQYPWLSTLASITAPLFGVMNAVDIFYGGLPLELALAFVTSLVTSFFFFFFFDRILSGNGFLRGIAIVLLVLLVATSSSFLLDSVPSSSQVLLPPFRSSAYEGTSTYEGSVIYFALIGYSIGLLTAFGFKQWLRVLIGKNINHWLRRTISLMSNLFILCASITSLLQFFDLTLLLVIVSLILPLLSMLKR